MLFLTLKEYVIGSVHRPSNVILGIRNMEITDRRR